MLCCFSSSAIYKASQISIPENLLVSLFLMARSTGLAERLSAGTKLKARSPILFITCIGLGYWWYCQDDTEGTLFTLLSVTLWINS